MLAGRGLGLPSCQQPARSRDLPGLEIDLKTVGPDEELQVELAGGGPADLLLIARGGPLDLLGGLARLGLAFQHELGNAAGDGHPDVEVAVAAGVLVELVDEDLGVDAGGRIASQPPALDDEGGPLLGPILDLLGVDGHDTSFPAEEGRRLGALGRRPGIGQVDDLRLHGPQVDRLGELRAHRGELFGPGVAPGQQLVGLLLPALGLFLPGEQFELRLALLRLVFAEHFGVGLIVGNPLAKLAEPFGRVDAVVLLPQRLQARFELGPHGEQFPQPFEHRFERLGLDAFGVADPLDGVADAELGDRQEDHEDADDVGHRIEQGVEASAAGFAWSSHGVLLLEYAQVDLAVPDDRQLAVAGAVGSGHGAGGVEGRQGVVANQEDRGGLGRGGDAFEQGGQLLVGAEVGAADPPRLAVVHDDVGGGALDEGRLEVDAASARPDDHLGLVGPDAELFELGGQLRSLLLLGGESIDWFPPIAPIGPADGPAPLVTNAEINQIADLFGLHFNADTVSDPLRYDGAKTNAILGPKEDILVIEASSLAISKDAFPLARTTPSGYVTAAAGAGPEALDQGADGEAALAPEEMPLSVMADEVLPPDVVPMPADGEVPAEGEPATATAEEAGMEVSSDPVPMAGLAFTGPIVIAAIDFGRKGEDTVGVFRNGAWYLDYDNDGITDSIVTFGMSSDIPVIGDWNGDGKDGIGAFRPLAQMFYLDFNNDGVTDAKISYGSSSDTPVAGDWNGDGRNSIGVFNNGWWNLDYDNNGVADLIIKYGISGDIPISGDWNGDGKDGIGAFRPSSGMLYLDYNNDGVTDATLKYGLSGDKPIAGDWNGDGRDSVGMFRPSSSRFYLDYNNDGITDSSVRYGVGTDKAVRGDWLKKQT